MLTALTAMFWSGVNLLIVGAILFYVGMVTVVYLTGGLDHALRINWRDPARAAQNLLIWVGVKVMGVIVRVAKPAYEMFTDTSAELGEVLLGRRSAKVEAAVWSRIRR
jgi:hypothetical protein